MINRIWRWLLLNNPSGVACFLTVLALAVVYFLLALVGFLNIRSVPMAMRALAVVGVVMFFVAPLLVKIFTRND